MIGYNKKKIEFGPEAKFLHVYRASKLTFKKYFSRMKAGISLSWTVNNLVL